MKISSLIALLFTTSVLAAMETAIDSSTLDTRANSHRIEPTVLSSDERFELVKDVIARNPDVAMRTQLPELVETFWKPDFAYARRQIEKQDGTHFNKKGSPISARPLQSEILQALDAVNAMVLENQDSMSFGYLNFACGVMAEVLSSENALRIGTNNTYSRDESIIEVTNIREFTQELKKMNSCYSHLYGSNAVPKGDLVEIEVVTLPSGLDTLINASPCVIILPHISQKGFVKIQTINDGLGFTINEKNYAVGFLGIGTNKSLGYDGVKSGQNAVRLRHHDFNHIKGWLDKTGVDEDTTSMSLSLMADFMNRIQPVRSQPAVEYVLYDLFHENFASTHTISQMIEYIKNPVVERSAPGLGNNLHYGVEAYRQWGIPSAVHVAMEDAESLLGYKFEGVDAFDRCMSGFLPFYDEGMKLIQGALVK